MKLFFDMMGADMLILNKCEEKARFAFNVAGAVVFSFLIVTFISAFYLLTYVSDNYFADFFIAVILTFTVINLYRFSISNLGWMADEQEWKKDTAKRELDPPDTKSSCAKLFVLSLLFLFVSKPIELLIFHPLIAGYISSYKQGERERITKEVEGLFNEQMGVISKELALMEANLQRLNLQLQNIQRQKERSSNYLTSSQLKSQISKLNIELVLSQKKYKSKAPLLQQQLEDLSETKQRELRQRLGNMQSGETLIVNLNLLNRHLPATWLFTIVFIAIFLSPVIWRTFYKKYGNEEYEIKRIELEMDLIDNAYQAFREKYSEYFQEKFSRQLQFQELYLDPPYNRHPIQDNTIYGNKNLLITFLTDSFNFKKNHTQNSSSKERDGFAGETMQDSPPPDDAN